MDSTEGGFIAAPGLAFSTANPAVDMVNTTTPQSQQHSVNALWTQPRASQQQSRLMQLPTELRLMILRELLTIDYPIAERDQYAKPWRQAPWEPRRRRKNGRYLKTTKTTRVVGFNLTPAILRTCQELLVNGWPILYRENTLQIDFTLGNYTGFYLTNRLICQSEIPGCRRCVIVTTLGDEAMEWRICRPSVRWFYDPNVERVALRFSKVRFTIRADISDEARYSLRTLVRRWAGDPRAPRKSFEVQMVEPPMFLGDAHRDILHSFRLMRAQAFEFLPGFPHPLHHIHPDVEREVLSRLPIMDLQAVSNAMEPVFRFLDIELPMRNMVAEHQRFWGYFHQMDIAARIFDAVRFLNNYLAMMNLYRSTQRTIDHEITTRAGVVAAAYRARVPAPLPPPPPPLQ